MGRLLRVLHQNLLPLGFSVLLITPVFVSAEENDLRNPFKEFNNVEFDTRALMALFGVDGIRKEHPERVTPKLVERISGRVQWSNRLLFNHGRVEESQKEWTRGRQLLEASVGKSHILVHDLISHRVEVLIKYAHDKMTKPKASKSALLMAERLCYHSENILTSLSTQKHRVPEMSLLKSHLAVVLAAQGKVANAIIEMTRSIELLHDHFIKGKTKVDVDVRYYHAERIGELGDLYRRAKDYKRSKKHLFEARDILLKYFKPTSLKLRNVYRYLAQRASDKGNPFGVAVYAGLDLQIAATRQGITPNMLRAIAVYYDAMGLPEIAKKIRAGYSKADLKPEIEGTVDFLIREIIRDSYKKKSITLSQWKAEVSKLNVNRCSAEIVLIAHLLFQYMGREALQELLLTDIQSFSKLRLPVLRERIRHLLRHGTSHEDVSYLLKAHIKYFLPDEAVDGVSLRKTVAKVGKQVEKLPDTSRFLGRDFREGLIAEMVKKFGSAEALTEQGWHVFLKLKIGEAHLDAGKLHAAVRKFVSRSRSNWNAANLKPIVELLLKECIRQGKKR